MRQGSLVLLVAPALAFTLPSHAPSLCATHRSDITTMLAGKPQMNHMNGAQSSRGFGRPSVAAGPTAKEHLRKSIRLYEQFDVDHGRSNLSSVLTKYAITMRSPGRIAWADWVPLAILAVQSGPSSQPASLVASALGASAICLFEAGCQAYPTLRKLPRESFEYAYEPLDAFQKLVYESIPHRYERRAKAAQVLGCKSTAR